MIRALCAFAFVLLAALPTRAADIQNIDLGKNATIWFAEDHTVPIIAFNISMPAGSAYVPAGKAGAVARRHPHLPAAVRTDRPGIRRRDVPGFGRRRSGCRSSLALLVLRCTHGSVLLGRVGHRVSGRRHRG